MSVLKFDKSRLTDPDYTLSREMLQTNQSGGYMSTTISCCNTRKYHGLFVSPAAEDPRQEYVLLSSLDETLLLGTETFELATHCYPDVYAPQGYRYMEDFSYAPCPKLTFRAGGLELSKEIIFGHLRPQLLIRYRLIGENQNCILRLRPFFAYRDKHSLSKSNFDADGHSYPISGGVRNRLYKGFPWLYLQTDAHNPEFVAAPDWYYNFEYPEERDRGYDYREDLFTTGYFEIALDSEHDVIFRCGLSEADPKNLSGQFAEELAMTKLKDDYMSCLKHSAKQFLIERESGSEIIAGYQWFGSWGRDTLISLPGLAAAFDDRQHCISILDTMVAQLKNGLFPNTGSAYNSVDAPLWFFHALQELSGEISGRDLWRRYGAAMISILESYRNGIGEYIKVSDEGLVAAQHPAWAMTWMDAVADGRPVTGREGFQVEVNALWYNAISYTLELASRYGRKTFIKEWKDMPAKIRKTFMEKFWYDAGGYLADYVTAAGEQNLQIRPNQVIACSLRYRIPNDAQCKKILGCVKKHLLTPRGLRSLSPEDPEYKGIYKGNQTERDRAYHQGTVWVWPLEHYVKACMEIFGDRYLPEAEKLLSGFAEDMNDYGLGSVCEIYDGDTPHRQRGAISQAWSIAALLRIARMTDEKRRVKK